MKLLLLCCCLLAGCQLASAQTLEADVAAKSCACLQRQSTITNETIRSCISSALGQVATADTTRRYRRQLSSVEAIQATLREVHTRLRWECDALPPGK